MSENQIKDRIIKELKKAKEAGQVNAGKVREIVKDAVSAAAAETRGGIENARPVVKNAVDVSIEGLKNVGADISKTVEGAVEGAISGVCSHKDQAVETTREEIRKLEARLKEEKTALAQSLIEGLEGAKESGSALSADAKKRVEVALFDVKLKSTELLGLTRETVKEAVKQAIESGKDIKETVAQIAVDATERAIKEGRFTAERIKAISEKVMSGAIEAADEADKEIKEVAAGVFEGSQKGIAAAIDSIGEKAKTFVKEDLAQTKEELEAIEELFIETTRKVARRSGETAKEVLNDLADQTKKTSSVLKKKAAHAGKETAERLKEAGKDAAKATAEAAGKAAHVMAKEAKELGKRSVGVAKGAISGMWKGAKDALKQKKD